MKKGIKIPPFKSNQEGILTTEKNKGFLTIISHNIKNSFEAMLGYSDLILKDYNELCDAEKILYLSELKKTANHTYNYLVRFFEWIYYKTDKITTNFQLLNLQEIIAKSIEKLLLNSEY